jgi:hypothetical protein
MLGPRPTPLNRRPAILVLSGPHHPPRLRSRLGLRSDPDSEVLTGSGRTAELAVCDTLSTIEKDLPRAGPRGLSSPLSLARDDPQHGAVFDSERT